MCSHNYQWDGLCWKAQDEEVSDFVPFGIQVNEAGKFWCYIVDSRFRFPQCDINPGVHYLDNVAGYHVGDKIDLCGYRWMITDCKVMGYSFGFKWVTLNHGVPMIRGLRCLENDALTER